MEKAIMRWKYCRWMGLSFTDCLQAFLFGKKIFK